MKILALDLATQLGWADYNGELILSGTESFAVKAGDSPGLRFLMFDIWLRDMMLSGGYDVVGYEQAHLRGGPPTWVIVGMIAIMKKLCAEFDVEFTDKHTGTIKKFATGHGKASKQDMIDAAESKFPYQKIIDDNQADALHLLSLVVFDLTGEDICNAGM